MARKIILEHKEYTMPKVTVNTYMDYLDASETIDSISGKYTRTHFQLMIEMICKVYGNQFTDVQLTNADDGLDAAGIILEFMLIDKEIGDQVTARVEKIEKNFSKSK